jgi:hypothetical protein
LIGNSDYLIIAQTVNSWHCLNGIETIGDEDILYFFASLELERYSQVFRPRAESILVAHKTAVDSSALILLMERVTETTVNFTNV